MEKNGTEPIYPAAPLEAVVTNEQQQPLMPPAPPTYDQATGTTPAPPAAAAAAPTTTSSGPHVVIVTQPIAIGGQFGPTPIDILCPFCNNFTRTRLRFHPTARTHLYALLLCIFQLYCCICLPYCMGSCMATNHYCGMCDQYLGTYERA